MVDNYSIGFRPAPGTMLKLFAFDEGVEGLAPWVASIKAEGYYCRFCKQTNHHDDFGTIQNDRCRELIKLMSWWTRWVKGRRRTKELTAPALILWCRLMPLLPISNHPIKQDSTKVITTKNGYIKQRVRLPPGMLLARPHIYA